MLAFHYGRSLFDEGQRHWGANESGKALAVTDWRFPFQVILNLHRAAISKHRSDPHISDMNHIGTSHGLHVRPKFCGCDARQILGDIYGLEENGQGHESVRKQ
jgi:hypothetical protein